MYYGFYYVFSLNANRHYDCVGYIGMNALDSDGQLLSAGGKTAERDIVQFVA